MIDQKWVVVRTGEPTPLSIHDRRRDAVTAARAIADSEDADLVVFDLGGRRLPPDVQEAST